MGRSLPRVPTEIRGGKLLLSCLLLEICRGGDGNTVLHALLELSAVEE
jgi:hypothetical protein